MTIRTKIVLGGAAALAGLAVSVFLLVQNRDEARLRRAIRQLAEQLHADGRMNALAAAARAQRVAGYFVEQPRIEVDLDYARPASRAEIVSLTAQALMQSDALDVTLRDVTVTVNADRSTARMEVTASAYARSGDDSDRLVREFELDWTRTPDGWRIERAVSVSAIRPVP